MPLNAIDFSKTIIYKLVCNDKTVKELYVGSTTDFITRKSKHKSDCISHKNIKVYSIMNANGGWGNWDMVQIEPFPCSNRQEAYAREREIYDQLDATMNTNKPALTDEERDNYIHDYYQNNKEALKETNREYRQNNKESIQNYRQNNKEAIKETKHKYYQINKTKIQEHNNVKFNCICGGKYTYANTVQHMKSNKHQLFICQSI